MSMVRGTIEVNAGANTPQPPPAADAEVTTTTADPTANDDAAALRVEIADLTRRVIVGTVLTAPVLFAVMAHAVFGANWVPSVLLNRWCSSR